MHPLLTASEKQTSCQPDLKSRINQALRATPSERTVNNGTGDVVENNVTPIYSYDSNIPANKGLLILPGNKIQNAVKINELGFSRQDMESLNELRTYWTAFGAVVADTDQCYELAFS